MELERPRSAGHLEHAPESRRGTPGKKGDVHFKICHCQLPCHSPRPRHCKLAQTNPNHLSPRRHASSVQAEILDLLGTEQTTNPIPRRRFPAHYVLTSPNRRHRALLLTSNRSPTNLEPNFDHSESVARCFTVLCCPVLCCTAGICDPPCLQVDG